MGTVSYIDIPDTDDPLENLVVFLKLFELRNSNYIEFAKTLNHYYRIVINEIERNKVVLSKAQYNRYEQQFTNTINILEVPKFPNRRELKNSLKPYGGWSDIKEFTLEMFLFFEPNDSLFEDLNINIPSYDVQGRKMVDKMWTLQYLFYKATYNLSIRNAKYSLSNKLKPNSFTEYYPEIFRKKAYYNIFKDYMDNHLVSPYNDSGYIFQKLKSLDYIFKMTHVHFAKWLCDNEFIDDDILDEIKIKGTFSPLSKLTANKRESIFENLSKKYLS